MEEEGKEDERKGYTRPTVARKVLQSKIGG